MFSAPRGLLEVESAPVRSKRILPVQRIATLILTFAIVLTANADNKKAPPPPPPPAPVEVPVLKIAVTSFTGVNVKPELLQFFTEHFGSSLAANGVKVTTPAQIQAVIGLERQKQLLGCGESTESCIAELGNALGVDGIATANIALLDTTYRMNVRIVSATTGEVLASGTPTLKSQNAVVDELTVAAQKMSRLAAGRANRRLEISRAKIVEPEVVEEPVVVAEPEVGNPEVVKKPDEERKPAVVVTPPTKKTDAPTRVDAPVKTRSNTGSVVMIVGGSVLLLGGGGALVGALMTYDSIRRGEPATFNDAGIAVTTGVLLETIAYPMLIGGLAGLIIGIASYESAPAAPVSANIAIGPNGVGFVLSGALP